MKTVNVHEAKTHLSRLLEEASGGEEIIIARAGKPVARLGPIADSKSVPVFGRLKGQVWISDDFDAPLGEDLLDSFHTPL